MIPLMDVKGTGIRVTTNRLGAFPTPQHKSVDSHGLRIRGYREADRPAVRRLCCDTGFLGNPIDQVFLDRDLFADLFTGAYLDYQPEWALVAEVDGRAIGYLLGAVSAHFDLLLMRKGFSIVAKMICRLLAGRYAGHARSRRFIRWLLTAGYQEQPKHPANSAHFHFDLAGQYRGRGIGRLLWESYRERLLSAGMKHCYGAFFSHARRRPEAVYARYGFKVYDRKTTSLFHPEIDHLEIVCMHSEL